MHDTRFSGNKCVKTPARGKTKGVYHCDECTISQSIDLLCAWDAFHKSHKGIKIISRDINGKMSFLHTFICLQSDFYLPGKGGKHI